MKIKIIIPLLLISVNFIFSQEKKVQLKKNEILTIDNPVNGEFKNGFYRCNKFDWKIKVPENYNVTNDTKSTHLIGFNLDAKNLFSSSYNPLDSSKEITLDEHQKLFVEKLNEAFSAVKNARFDLKTTNVKLGKYQSYKVKVEAYDAKDNKLVLTQIYYNSYINDHLFSVLISYDDEKHGELLEDNFLYSMRK